MSCDLPHPFARSQGFSAGLSFADSSVAAGGASDAFLPNLISATALAALLSGVYFYQAVAADDK